MFILPGRCLLYSCLHAQALDLTHDKYLSMIYIALYSYYCAATHRCQLKFGGDLLGMKFYSEGFLNVWLALFRLSVRGSWVRLAPLQSGNIIHYLTFYL